MRRALLSLLGLVWVLVLLAVAVGWGPFAGSSLPSTISPPPVHAVPSWIAREHLPLRAVAGAKFFAVAGCTACHTYAGYGQSSLGAPDLTAIGSRHLGLELEIAHLACPSCAVTGSAMPAYGALGGNRLHDLAIFLEASKGTH